jgi:hypothetical protein
MLLEIFVSSRIRRMFRRGNGNLKVSSHPDRCTGHIFQDLQDMNQRWLFGNLGPLSSASLKCGYTFGAEQSLYHGQAG